MFRRTAAVGFTAIEGFLDRLVCVLGAVCAAQAPEFFQQYLQRLGGHLAEINRQLVAYHAAAQAAGKPLAQFIAETTAHADPGLAKLGTTMDATVQRAEHLAAAHFALTDASVWSRPWEFFAHLDVEIVRGTAAIYQPAVPTTAEGAVYAAVGLGVAFAIWHVFIRLPLRRLLAPARPTAAPVR